MAVPVPVPSGAPRSRSRSLLRSPQPGDLAFVAVLLFGTILVLVLTRGMSFFADDWEFLVNRRGVSAETLLRPHGPHLSLLPILIYKGLLQLFGGAYLPFRLLAAFDIALLAGTLGLVARARWGPWWGLAPMLLLVTLGPAGTSLLWSFQCGYAIATAAGLMALLAIGRRSRRGDWVACAALLVSLASASQGVGYLAGAAVMLALHRNIRARAWLFVVPAVLYALWYLKYGHQASETQLSLWNTALPYSVQSLAATLAPLTGLSTVSTATGLLDRTFGDPLALAALALLGFFLWRGWRPPPLFWGAAATLVVLWSASAVSDTATAYRPPDDPRYLSTNAFLMMVCLLTALPQPRIDRRGAAVVAVVLAVIGATNIKQYALARSVMLTSDIDSRAQLGALVLLRGDVAPTFPPATALEPSVLVGVSEANFLSADGAFGLPFDSVAQIRASDEAVRDAVDTEMARGELSLQPVNAVPPPTGATPVVLSGTPGAESPSCVSVARTALVLRLRPGATYELRAGHGLPMAAMAARFGGIDANVVGSVPAGSGAVLRVLADHAPQVPWRLTLTGTGGKICTVR